MDELIHGLVKNLGIGYLFVITAVMLYLLAKGADLLVDEAVTLSTRWGVPKVLIGATVVSLGTTAPEASVSVLAAIKGSPGLALGNAVGSIICDTGLILGTAALIAPLPLNRKIVNRQGWLQLGAGFLLVIACLPFGSLHTTFSEELLFSVELKHQSELDEGSLSDNLKQEFQSQGISLSQSSTVSVLQEGRKWQVTHPEKSRCYSIRKESDEISIYKGGGQLPQFMGFVFLVLLAAYLWQSIRWSRNQDSGISTEETEESADSHNVLFSFFKLLFAIVIVVVSSLILIPTVKEIALRIHVPDSIIAATLVAFGTSLPEFVTVVAAARRGHGELAVGNIIGADILNVLFVCGAAAAVTKGGLFAEAQFFRLFFPTMLFILIVFRVGIFVSGSKLKRPFGFVLIGAYIVVTILSYAYGT